MSNFEQYDEHITMLGGGGAPSAIAPDLLKVLPDHMGLEVVTATCDSGNSTGKLRNVFGGVAVGDLRKNIASVSDVEMRGLLEQRFGSDVTMEKIAKLVTQLEDSIASKHSAEDIDEARAALSLTLKVSEHLQSLSTQEGGGLAGHTFGNLAMYGMNKFYKGDIALVVKRLSEWTKAKAKIIPVTTEMHDIVLHEDGKSPVIGEGAIDAHPIANPQRATLSFAGKTPAVASEAYRSLAGARAIIVGPGSLFTSILPVLMVDGVARAIRESSRPFVFVGNLVPEPMHCLGIAGYIDKIQAEVGRQFDYAIYDKRSFRTSIGVVTPRIGDIEVDTTAQFIGADLASKEKIQKDPNDAIAHLRSEVHHNGRVLGKILLHRVLASEDAQPFLEHAPAEHVPAMATR